MQEEQTQQESSFQMLMVKLTKREGNRFHHTEIQILVDFVFRR